MCRRAEFGQQHGSGSNVAFSRTTWVPMELPGDSAPPVRTSRWPHVPLPPKVPVFSTVPVMVPLLVNGGIGHIAVMPPAFTKAPVFASMCRGRGRTGPDAAVV